MCHNTLHCTGGESPAILLMGRRLRIKLDIVLPSGNKTVATKQEAMMKQSVHHCARVMQRGGNVQYRCYHSRGSPWKFGEVSQVLGARNSMVKDGNLKVKRHLDKLVKILEKAKENKQADHSCQSLHQRVPSNSGNKGASKREASDDVVHEEV